MSFLQADVVPLLTCKNTNCPYGSWGDSPCQPLKKQGGANICPANRICTTYTCQNTDRPLCCRDCSWNPGNMCYGCKTIVMCGTQ